MAGLALFGVLSIQAQDLPQFIDINGDQTLLTTGNQEIKGFYNESKLRSIYLEFEDSNYWSLLEDYYDTENYVQATLIYKDDTLYNVGVQFKGNTSYMLLGEDDEKMSFSIKTDEFIEDQDIDGYNNLNLNNAHEDMSFMREVLYAHLCRMHIPAPQANFVQLFINGEYWGPYTNVQQVNKDLLEEWFLSNDGANFRATGPDSGIGSGGGPGGGPGGGGPGGGGPGGGSQWGQGEAALNYLDADTTTYQDHYTLKSTEIENPWDKLVEVCDVLNNTDINDLESTLRDYMDIDRTLWFLAHEIIYSDDDSYVYKGEMDYYVYYEPETGRMVPLEFDGNSSLANENADWDIFMNEDNENYPLMNRLMQVPSLRQRYLAHVRTILDEELDVDAIHDLIDTYAALLDSSIQADPKKLMTYQEYLDGVDDLKDFFTTRKSFLLGDSEIDQSGIKINNVEFQANDSTALPFAEETMTIIASLGSGDVSAVNLHYATGFVGNFESVEMSLSSGTEYVGEIPGFDAGTYVRYYIEVIADDGLATATYSPTGTEHNSYLYKVKYDETATSAIVINELLAANDVTNSDLAGEYDDWVELYNTTDSVISLSGLFLSDNIENLDKFALPDVTLGAGEYLLIWADEDGSQGDDHANFKLDSDGEDLFLVDSTGTILDQVSFYGLEDDIAYARSPNGSGLFATVTPTPEAYNDGEKVTLSISESKPGKLVIYPNPVRQTLFLVNDQATASEIQILSLTGQLITQFQIKSGINEVDVSSWTTGIYFVRSGDQVQRLVVR